MLAGLVFVVSVVVLMMAMECLLQELIMTLVVVIILMILLKVIMTLVVIILMILLGMMMMIVMSGFQGDASVASKGGNSHRCRFPACFSSPNLLARCYQPLWENCLK